MFHAKDGWYFERTGTGDVRVIVKPAGYAGSLTTTVEFNVDTWASIVAAVSARGDTADAWKEALELHNRK